MAIPDSMTSRGYLSALRILLHSAIRLKMTNGSPERGPSMQNGLARAISQCIELCRIPPPSWSNSEIVIPRELLETLLSLANTIPEAVTDELLEALRKDYERWTSSNQPLLSGSFNDSEVHYREAYLQLLRSLPVALYNRVSTGQNTGT